MTNNEYKNTFIYELNDIKRRVKKLIEWSSKDPDYLCELWSIMDNLDWILGETTH